MPQSTGFNPKIHTAYDKDTEILALPPGGVPHFVKWTELTPQHQVAAYDFKDDSISFEDHAGLQHFEDPEGLEVVSVQHSQFSLIATPGSEVSIQKVKGESSLNRTTLQEFWESYAAPRGWGFIRAGQWGNTTLLNQEVAFFVGFLHGTMRKYHPETGRLSLYFGSYNHYINRLREFDRKYNGQNTIPDKSLGYCWGHMMIPPHLRKYFQETEGYQHPYMRPPLNRELCFALCSPDIFRGFLEGINEGGLGQSQRIYQRRLNPIPKSIILHYYPRGTLDQLAALSALNGWAVKGLENHPYDWGTLIFYPEDFHINMKYQNPLNIQLLPYRDRVYWVSTSTGGVVLRRYQVTFVSGVPVSQP